MTDELQDDDVQDARGEVDDSGRTATAGGSRTRRHLVVLIVALVGLAIGGGLVISGRSSPNAGTSGRTTTSTTPAGDLLPSLGVVPDLAAAKDLLNRLDPRSLRPDPNATTTSGPTPTSAPRTSETSVVGAPMTLVRPGQEATPAGLRRCQQPIEQQSTDRSLGDRLAAARLQVGVTTDLVASYALPASGTHPATVRVILVSARSCRVLAAVQH